jgi:dethiobiotin synthetase
VSGLFITGTGTGVGKTYVAALIVQALRKTGQRVGVYKPVASGCVVRDGQLISPDAVALWEAAGRPGTLDQVCPQMFAAPLAPHLAARAERKRVDSRLLLSGIGFWHRSFDIVIVEGAGGLMSPISDVDYNADLAMAFRYPLVVVSANELGTINSTVQTLITARTYDPYGAKSDTAPCLNVAGIVLNSRQVTNDPSTQSNADELRFRCEVPLLTVVEYGGGFDRAVDWAACAKLPANEN